jgi:hypothetical protein
MTIKKSEEEWHAELDELVDSMTDTFLTEEECERKWYLKKLIDDGYYEPFMVDGGDLAALMTEKKIVSEEDAPSFSFSREDEKKLVKVLENEWDNLSKYDKFAYHVINHTADLPCWRRPYSPTQEFIQRLNAFLSMNPKSTKFRTWI